MCWGQGTCFCPVQFYTLLSLTGFHISTASALLLGRLNIPLFHMGFFLLNGRDVITRQFLQCINYIECCLEQYKAYVDFVIDTGYYDGCSYPAPSYCNPIPWKPIPAPCSEDNIKKTTLKEKAKPKSTSLYIPHSNVAFRPKDNLLVGNGWRKAR